MSRSPCTISEFAFMVESPQHWKGEIVGFADGEEATATTDLIRKSNTEWVYEAEYDNGDVERSVFRKVKREQKRTSKN